MSCLAEQKNDKKIELSKVLQLYGEEYTEEGTAYVYTRGETMLYIIAQDDVVISIEYRWKVQ